MLNNKRLCVFLVLAKRRGGLTVSALASRSSGSGSSPDQGHCIVLLGKTLHSHIASLHLGVQMTVLANLFLGVIPAVEQHSIQKAKPF